MDFWTLMKSEKNRLNSFRTPYFDTRCPVAPEKLAEVGFCNATVDKVVCAFCKKFVLDWKPGDDPARKHYRESPKCPFVMGRDVENVPLDPKSSSPFGFLKPRRPMMAKLDDRLSTFNEWPTRGPNPHALASAGLYYLGKEDAVRCYWCAGVLENWKPEDDPLTEHGRKYPDCVFLEKSSTVVSKKVARISKDPQIGDPSTCIVCMDEKREILFFKCRHIVSCKNCSVNLHSCPVCRRRILKKILIYLS